MFAALGLAVLLPGTGAAAFSRDFAGTSGGQFLKIPVDARGAAMGGAMGAAASDVSALFWNPAGLASLTSRQVMGSGLLYVQDARFGFLGFAQPLETLISKPRRELSPTGLGTLAFGVTYLNYGALKEADNVGNETDRSFSPTDLAISGGWGGAVTRNLDVGVAVKIIRTQIEDSASTAAADAGARLRLRLGPVPYAVSASVHNTLGQIRFHHEADPLPVTARFGFAAELLPFPIVTVAFDAVLPRDNNAYPCIGAELNYPVDRRVSIAGRAGYNGMTTQGQLEGNTGYTVGGGISLYGATFDYAWQPLGTLGTTHRFTLSYRF